MKIYKYLKMMAIVIIFNLFTFNVNSQVSMTITGSATQNFDALGPAGGIWIDNNTISNWYWDQDIFGTVGYKADDGHTNPSTTTRYAYFGIGASTPEIAIGGIAVEGTGLGMGIQLKNNSGAEINDIKITYTGEQWRCDGSGQSSKLTFWYKVSSSMINDLSLGNDAGWTPVSSLDFTSPILFTAGTGQLNGNDPANRTTFTNITIPGLIIPDGSYIMFRWKYAVQSAKHGLAIDDVTINWVGNSVCSGGNWGTKKNWNYGVPNGTTNAVMNGAVVSNTNNKSCYNLIINAGKSLTINSGIILTANKNLLIKDDVTNGAGNLLNNGTLNITGSPSVQLYVQGTTIHNGVYFSPPLNSINANDVSDTVYRYNASTCSWIIVNSKLLVGTGYTIRSNNSVIKTMNDGNLCNSAIFIGGLVRQSTPCNNYGWNLVGNPFVCGLDWEILNDVASNYTNLTNGFYIRCSDGSLASYVNGVGTPAGTTSIIPPMQGFYAQVLLGQTSGNINMPLNARVINSHILYVHLIPIIRIKLSNDKYSDETVIRIDNNATENFDNNLDANKMFSDNLQIFSFSKDNYELCINAINVSKEIEIPIGFITTSEGNYTINVFDFDNIDKNISFYLKDKETNTLQNLKDNSTYTFYTITTYNTNRFSIILNMKNDNINNKNNSNVDIYSINKTVYIQNDKNSLVKIYDIVGKEILSRQINSGLQKIDLSVNEGVYIVKVITDKCNIVKKIIIK